MDWPAPYLWTARQYRRGYYGPRTWMGSLIQESRDASGLYYRRNRYYDSETGAFTQEDPIGLAGGMNVYGFAEGDPVNAKDPFGLRQCYEIRSEIRTRINRLSKKIGEYVRSHERGEADMDHLGNIRGDQNALQRVRNEYYDSGCDDDNDDDHRNFQGRLSSAHHFINVPLPFPQLAQNPRRFPPPQAQADAVSVAVWPRDAEGSGLSPGPTAGVIVGGGYLLYRGARLLLSAPPPMWPTLPVNLATP